MDYNKNSKLTVRTFTKAGFVHHTDKDFSDDGTNFKVLSYNGIYVSYAKDDSNIYADIRLDYTGYKYDDYKTLASYDLTNDFNGVDLYRFDMDAFIANINTVKADLDNNNHIDLVTKATGIVADNDSNYSITLDQDTDVKVFRSKASKAVLASLQNGDILFTIDDVQNLLDLMKAVNHNA